MPQVKGTDPGDGIDGYGTTLVGATLNAIGMITRVSLSGCDADMIDITTMNTTGKWKRFIAGLKDAKDVSFDLVYEKANMATLLGGLGGAAEVWTIEFPDGSTFACSGVIQHLGTTSPNGDKITQTLTIKFSGQPTFTPGA